MAHTCGKFVTLNQGYASSPEQNKEIIIRENWMNGPARNNFTGCGGAGWNAFKAPCSQCKDTGRYGGRICNACRTNATISKDCGGNACAWQQTPFYF